MKKMQPLTNAQQRLVEENIGLAHSVAGGFLLKGRAVGMDYDDLVSLAYIGLCRGAQLYDASISKPSTYLWRWCAGAIERGIVCEHLAHGSRVNAKYYSLDAPLPEREDGSSGDSFHCFIVDPCADVEESVVSKLDIQEKALDMGRTERDKRIIRRWLDGMTLREIAKLEGISMQAVQHKTSRCKKALIASAKEEMP